MRGSCYSLLSLFVGLLFLSANALALDCGGQTVPESGDWMVNGSVACTGKDIVLNGSLLISGSGSLTLDGSTLGFNSTADGEFGIESNGTLIVQSSAIESGSRYAYHFVSNPGAVLIIRDSWVRDCGHGSPDDGGRGLRVRSGGASITNTTFEDNYVALFINSSNCNVSGNRMITNRDGLGAHGPGNAISRNLISGNAGMGITGLGGEDVVFEHNVVLNNSGQGLPLMDLNGSVVNNNSFANNTAGGFGVSGNGNSVTGNVITSNQGQGIRVMDSENATLHGNILIGNEYGLLLRNVRNSMVTDNECNMSGEYDVYMLSFESGVFNGTYTTLVKKWSLDLAVVDTGSDPLEGADVLITNNLTGVAFSGTTGIDGTIGTLFLEEMEENESGAFVYNPYAVNVSMSGYHGNATGFNLTSDVSLTIVLNSTNGTGGLDGTNATLSLEITSPLNKTYLKGDVDENETIALIVTGDANMTSCSYGIVNLTQDMDKNGTRTFTAILDFSELAGTYSVSVDCTSEEGATNSTEVVMTYFPHECMNSDDCEADEECGFYSNTCVDIICECGEIVNHRCNPYECCEDSDCGDDEECNMTAHECIPVDCLCPEKVYDHRCNIEPGYCCSDLQCGEKEVCDLGENECISRTLSFSLPESPAVGDRVSITVYDQNSDPVDNAKIVVNYPDADPVPEPETYYTDTGGIATFEVRYPGRMEVTARKGGHYTESHTAEVPEPFNVFFLLQVVVLMGAVAGIAVVSLKLLRGGGLSGVSLSLGPLSFGKSPLLLEKTVSGKRVMLIIRNRTEKRLTNITVRDSVPSGSFTKAAMTPKVERLDEENDVLTWEIISLAPKEEVDIEYTAESFNEGFSVKYKGKEYKA